MSIKSELMEIPPYLASAWLERNTSNRKLSRSTADAYARDMLSGNWSITHQGIAFYEDGSIADGQHRLYAIVLSGVPVKMFVTTGLARTHNIDRFRPRTIADCLKIDGHDWIDKSVVSVVGLIVGITSSNARRLTQSEVLEFATTYEDYLRFVSGLIVKRKGIAHAGVISAMVMALINGVSRQTISDFYACLETGIISETMPWLARFRDELMIGKVTDTGSNYRYNLCKRTQRAIKAFSNQERLSYIQTPSDLIYKL